jgi:hypothetical protein
MSFNISGDVDGTPAAETVDSTMQEDDQDDSFLEKYQRFSVTS